MLDICIDNLENGNREREEKEREKERDRYIDR